MAERSADLNTVKKWLDELLPHNKLALASKIAEWIFSIGESNPKIQIKVYKAQKISKPITDIRFCFSYDGDEFLERRRETHFFVIKKYQMQVVVSPESLRKYQEYLQKDQKFYFISKDDLENLWKTNDLKEIIYHAFYQRTQERGLSNIKAPLKYLSEPPSLNETPKKNSGEYIPSVDQVDEAIEVICREQGTVNDELLEPYLKKQMLDEGYSLHPDWWSEVVERHNRKS